MREESLRNVEVCTDTPDHRMIHRYYGNNLLVNVTNRLTQIVSLASKQRFEPATPGTAWFLNSTSYGLEGTLQLSHAQVVLDM